MGHVMFSMPDMGPGEPPDDAIRAKHREYNRLSKQFRFLYYATRLVAGLGAAGVPFVVSSHPEIATALSICVVVATVIDTVFSPKERWRINSKASDLLFVAGLKKRGDYDEFREQLKIILSAEDQQMLELVGIDSVIRTAQSQPGSTTVGKR